MIFVATDAHAQVNDLAARAAAARVNIGQIESVSTPRMNLSYNNFCQTVDVMAFQSSRHKGGDRNGGLNQENKGVGIRCSAGENAVSSALIGGLENSQRGSAFFAGYGFTLRTPELVRGLRAYAGIDALYVIYEWPSHRETVVRVLDVRNVGLNHELPYSWGSLSYNLGWLSSTGIRIRSFVWRVPTRFFQ
ncbi:MAG: hypothetical protein AAB442_01095 [Patescibacteria group bacterium]